MAVDVTIGTIETTLSAADSAMLRDPAFLRQVVALVKEELKREALEDARRDADRRASHGPGGGL